MQLDALELLGPEAHTLLHRAASVAAALLGQEKPPRVAQPAWVAGVAFPFPGEAEGEPPCADGALNRLVVADGLRRLAEELLGTGSDGVRLVTSRMLINDEQHQEANDSVALSLCPHSSDSSEALELLLPLTQSVTSTGTALILVRKLDPIGALSEAATASSEFMHAHPLTLRTVLRRKEATHIQCDSSQQAAPGLAVLLQGLSPSQRTLAFGFPLPGHPYWDRGTVAATAARYELDPSPYLDALPGKPVASDAGEEAEVKNRRTSAPKPEGWVPLPAPVWEEPEQALPLDSTDVLTPAQIRQWREQGWLVLDNIWPSDVIAAAAAAAEAIYPKPTPSADAPIVPGFTAGAAAQHERDFPFSRSALNEVVLHPRILRVAAQLLGTDDSGVRFYGDVVLGKYGALPPDGDQDLHLDYGNNTMLVPPASMPETVNVILNYSEDALETDGATRFVAERGLCPLAPQPGVGPPEPSPLRDSSEDLYGRERAVRYRPGSCLLYRLDFLHRGSPVLPGKVRWTHHTNYKRADCEWIGRSTWARNLWELEKSGLKEGFTRSIFLEGLSRTQRAALGMTEETQNRERLQSQNGGRERLLATGKL